MRTGRVLSLAAVLWCVQPAHAHRALFDPPAAPPVTPPPQTPPPPQAAAPDPSTEQLIAQIRAALVDRRDLEQDALLRALRRLRDPGLRALFAQLAGAERPVLRIHGILGLAELERPPRVELLLVKRLGDPREQLVVLGDALRAGMLSAEQLQDVTRWPNLDPSLLVLIYGRLQRAGAYVDPAAFEPFLAGESRPAAVLAALERRQLLPDAQAAAPTRGDELLNGMLVAEPGSADSLRLLDILDYIRRERLTRSDWLPLAILAADSGAPDPRSASLRFEALRTLLAIAPRDERTVAAFTGAYGVADLGDRYRLAMAALETITERPLAPPDFVGPPPPSLPDACFEPLRNDADPLLRQIGAAGAAAAPGLPAGVAEAIGAVVAQGHLPTVDWALRTAALASADDAAEIRLAVLDAAARLGPGRPALYDAAIVAAATLADAEPARLPPLLADACARGDAVLQRAILAGALQSNNRGVTALAQGGAAEGPGDDAATVPVCTDPVAAAMLTLLAARHRETPTESDYPPLVGVALGQTPASSLIPEAFRLQAAWLALRCRNQHRIALARILAPPSASTLPPAAPPTATAAPLAEPPSSR